jgi:predicted MFS family arabinose efflux permease
MICVVIALLGCSIAGNYLPTLLEQRGVGKKSLYPSLLLNAVAGVPGKMGGGVLIECFGRRRTIGTSIGVTALCLLGFAYCSSPNLLVALSSGISLVS